VAVLTRHFFTSLFDLGVLSEDGAESLKRVLLGGLALAIAIGLLLARVFMAKYGMLAGASSEAYARAVVADHAFLMALSMWVVAAAMVLAGQSLFPDETDFRILMAEPLRRAEVFGAKLAALLLFAGLFIAGSQAGLLPLGALTLIGAVKTGPLVPAAIAFAVTSLAASIVAALGIVALQGLLVLFASRRRLLLVSGAVRSIAIGGLVLALPLIGRLPGSADAFAAHAWWLAWTPPAWFAGLERWLLGDATRAGLALQASIAAGAAGTIATASYLTLYRRFDRVTFQAAGGQQGAATGPSLAAWCRGTPVRGAVRRFVALSLRRSLLHQGLAAGVLSAAAGLVFNSLLNASGWDRPVADVRGASVATLLWAPMTMLFLAIPGLRLALSVPLDVRANWIFRLTEDVEGRAEVAAAAGRTVLAWAVALPIALVAPLHWWVLGATSIRVLLVEIAIGWVLLEYAMTDFGRVPFTCSYIPGKGFVPQMCVKAFAAYVVFSVSSTLLLRLSIWYPAVAAGALVALGAAAVGLRTRSRRRARRTGLQFEDRLPSDVTPLQLGAD
jgi:hypothetical protein